MVHLLLRLYARVFPNLISFPLSWDNINLICDFGQVLLYLSFQIWKMDDFFFFFVTVFGPSLVVTEDSLLTLSSGIIPGWPRRSFGVPRYEPRLVLQSGIFLGGG